MKTVRRLFYADIVAAVAFVALLFLALFFFIYFVDELGSVGARGYTVVHAALYSLLSLPGVLYELMPIAVLIGTIYALARLAQTSQYTVLRTSGLGPGQALGLLTLLALAFGALTFAVGDAVVPTTERLASQLRAAFSGSLKLGRSGAWIKEHIASAEGAHTFSINVGSAKGGNELSEIRIFEFDAAGNLVSRIGAATATVAADGTWTLRQVAITHWPTTPGGPVQLEKLATYEWRSSLAPGVVAAAVLPVSTMSTLDLWRYIDHLAQNEQLANVQQIQFWKRALYPFACLVMVALALPFAYLGTRSGGVSFKVFVGIMIGVSFVLVNNVFRHLGLLGNWTPWVVAVAPGACYLVLSLAAFSWLVRYR